MNNQVSYHWILGLVDEMEWKIPLKVFKSSTVYLQITMFQFYLQNTVLHTNNISELLIQCFVQWHFKIFTIFIYNISYDYSLKY